ncbi:hypothetical protein ACJX0J_029459, partial [Zea mays]
FLVLHFVLAVAYLFSPIQNMVSYKKMNPILLNILERFSLTFSCLFEFAAQKLILVIS